MLSLLGQCGQLLSLMTGHSTACVPATAFSLGLVNAYYQLAVLPHHHSSACMMNFY